MSSINAIDLTLTNEKLVVRLGYTRQQILQAIGIQNTLPIQKPLPIDMKLLDATINTDWCKWQARQAGELPLPITTVLQLLSTVALCMRAVRDANIAMLGPRGHLVACYKGTYMEHQTQATLLAYIRQQRSSS